jgi:hypothetical protein
MSAVEAAAREKDLPSSEPPVTALNKVPAATRAMDFLWIFGNRQRKASDKSAESLQKPECSDPELNTRLQRAISCLQKFGDAAVDQYSFLKRYIKATPTELFDVLQSNSNPRHRPGAILHTYVGVRQNPDGEWELIHDTWGEGKAKIKKGQIVAVNLNRKVQYPNGSSVRGYYDVEAEHRFKIVPEGASAPEGKTIVELQNEYPMSKADAKSKYGYKGVSKYDTRRSYLPIKPSYVLDIPPSISKDATLVTEEGESMPITGGGIIVLDIEPSKLRTGAFDITQCHGIAPPYNETYVPYGSRGAVMSRLERGAVSSDTPRTRRRRSGRNTVDRAGDAALYAAGFLVRKTYETLQFGTGTATKALIVAGAMSLITDTNAFQWHGQMVQGWNQWNHHMNQGYNGQYETPYAPPAVSSPSADEVPETPPENLSDVLGRMQEEFPAVRVPDMPIILPLELGLDPDSPYANPEKPALTPDVVLPWREEDAIVEPAGEITPDPSTTVPSVKRVIIDK